MSDQLCNVIQVDVSDATKPSVRSSSKVEGIGVPNSLHIQPTSVSPEMDADND